jgi:hypothetical protein
MKILGNSSTTISLINKQPSRLFSAAFIADFTRLSLPIADTIANTAIEEATRRNFAPVTVVVVDPAGRVIVHKRMDHCANGPAAFAQAKVRKTISIQSMLESSSFLAIQALALLLLVCRGYLPTRSFVSKFSTWLNQ